MVAERQRARREDPECLFAFQKIPGGPRGEFSEEEAAEIRRRHRLD